MAAGGLAAASGWRDPDGAAEAASRSDQLAAEREDMGGCWRVLLPKATTSGSGRGVASFRCECGRDGWANGLLVKESVFKTIDVGVRYPPFALEMLERRAFVALALFVDGPNQRFVCPCPSIRPRADCGVASDLGVVFLSGREVMDP